jgi:hypothetical protein
LTGPAGGGPLPAALLVVVAVPGGWPRGVVVRFIRKLDATPLSTCLFVLAFHPFFLYFFFFSEQKTEKNKTSIAWPQFHQFEDEAVQHELIPLHYVARQRSRDPSKLPAPLCCSSFPILFHAPPATYGLANPWRAAIVEHRREAI